MFKPNCKPGQNEIPVGMDPQLITTDSPCHLYIHAIANPTSHSTQSQTFDCIAQSNLVACHSCQALQFILIIKLGSFWPAQKGFAGMRSLSASGTKDQPPRDYSSANSQPCLQFSFSLCDYPSQSNLVTHFHILMARRELYR